MIFGFFTISGHSMEPAILNGQTVVVSSLPYLLNKPKDSDIIAFKRGGKVLIKRIIEVQKGKYIVRGDNTHDSMDSRTFGFVQRKDVVGKVMLKLKNQSANIKTKT